MPPNPRSRSRHPPPTKRSGVPVRLQVAPPPHPPPLHKPVPSPHRPPLLPAPPPTQSGGGDSDDYDSSSDGEEVSSSYLTNIGRVVWAENTDKKSKNKEAWFPALIVAPSASDTVKIDTKEEFLIRSFKDGRYYTVSKKDTNRFHKESAKKSDKELVREGEIGATDCKKCPLKQIIFVS